VSFYRIVRHLVSDQRSVRNRFPKNSLAAIEEAIRRSEGTHRGEIRFAVEASLDWGPLFRGQTARQRSIEVFSQLRIWDTEENSGVLIYLLLADRDVEIVADRGINARVGAAEWERICREIETAFRGGRFEEGVVGGIAAITEHLTRYFPARKGDQDELSNAPVVL
jgi:uncharacterized membrane protein